MSRIAIIAAMPGELKPLVKGWKSVPTGQRFVYKWTGRICEYEVVAVCAGMGKDAVTRAFAAAETEGSFDAVLSVGWAGALREGEHVGVSGYFYIPNIVVDAQTGERFVLADRSKASVDEEHDVVLVTAAHVADEPEKRRLAATYNGTLVDMESATVVRLAQMRGIPVCCMKVITDEVTAKLPNINPFINAMGQMEMGRFIAHVLLRPRFWPALMRLGKASSAGADSLASAVTNFLICPAPRDIKEINRTGNIPDW